MNIVYTTCSNIILNPVLPHWFRLRTKRVDSDEKGEQHENIVFTALKEIIRRGLRIFNTPRILEVEKTEKYSRDDMSGADLKIKFSSGMDMPLQVKSSERGRLKFEKQAREHKSYTPVIVVKGVESIELIISKLISLVSEAYKKFSRVQNKIRLNARKKKSKDYCFRLHTARMCH